MTTPSLPTVLLVEDSADDAYFFQRALKKSTLECAFTHVWDGGAAVHFLEQAAAEGRSLPDLIFLDLKMPILSGFEVLQWLRTQGLLGQTCVIVLSGSSQETDKARARELGAWDYLVKPVSAQTIAARMETVQKTGCASGAPKRVDA